eukprot:gene3819-4752_t
MSINNKVFFVTGTSTGVGLSLVQKLIKDGYCVAALTRNPEELSKQVTEGDLNNLLIIKSDITNEESIKESVSKTLLKFKRIDVVVNNAGFGLLGSVEELSLSEIKNLFDVNLFSVFLIIKYVAPHFRKQGYTAYIASKYALAGLSESVDLDLKPFGVRSILLSLGGFKTEFVRVNVQIAKNEIPEYKTQDLFQYFKDVTDGDEIKGDTKKLAKLIIDLSNSKDILSLPNTFFIGSDTYQKISNVLDEKRKILEDNKEITFSTDY